MLVLVVLAEVCAILVLLHQLDVLVELLLLLTHLVDSLDELHVVLHEAGVVFAMLLQVTGKLRAIVVDVRLVGRALTCMRIVLLNVLLAVGFLLDPCLVQADHSLLQPLVVCDVLDDLKDVVLEALLLKFLHVQLVSTVQVLVLEALMTHF